MAPIWRLVAILGYPAHLIDRVARSALPFLPARFPSVLPVVALFGFVALQWWQTAAATDAQRRGPEPASVAAIVAGTDWDWVTFDALVSGPHADSSVYADEDDGPHYYRILNEAHDREGRRLGEDAPPGLLQLPEADGIPRWFYVLRDPQDPTAAVVARSARDADAMRTRTVIASISTAPDGSFEGIELDPADPQTAAAPPDVRSPSELRAGESGVMRIRGRFTDPVSVGSAFEYRVTDAAGGVVTISSPHPPDALPINVTGLVSGDAARLRTVLGVEAMAQALAGTDHPTARLFIDGIGFDFPEGSYLEAIVLGAIAVLLTVSLVVGYPVFRRVRGSTSEAASGLKVGEVLPVEIRGIVPDDGSRLRLEHADGDLAWRSDSGSRGDERVRLVLRAPEVHLFLPLDELQPGPTIRPGRVHSVRSSLPALALDGEGLRAILAFGSSEHRDRAGAALHAGVPAR